MNLSCAAFAESGLPSKRNPHCPRAAWNTQAKWNYKGFGGSLRTFGRWGSVLIWLCWLFIKIVVLYAAVSPAWRRVETFDVRMRDSIAYVQPVRLPKNVSIGNPGLDSQPDLPPLNLSDNSCVKTAALGIVPELGSER